jgi:hypothetical protein
VSSRSYLGIYIAQVENPAEQIVLEALLEDEQMTLLATNDTWEINETSHERFTEIVDRIIDIAPSTWFHATLGPNYSDTGATIYYTPVLGKFQSLGDSEGEPLFEARSIVAEVNAIVRGSGMNASTIDDAITKLYGLPWIDAIYPPSP